jgi:L-iditol 2-dehydrogenase
MASDYFLIDASKLHKLPSSMGYDAGAMVEPAAVAVHSVKTAGKVTGGKVLIIGAGPVGNLVAQAAKALGADKTMIADVNPIRLALAQKCGADFCIDTANKLFSATLA